ncbi:hypothetical protein BDN70DRAFT_764711, partial [Pholiota conissans]
WTTDEEFAWLKERIPAYLEAQEKNTTQAFFSNVHKEWDDHFQLPGPTEDEIKKAKGNVEAAERIKQKAAEKRLSQWFRNNTREGALASKEPIISIQRQTKLPAPWQAYQKL